MKHQPPDGVVLLAAGRGTRLAPLTNDSHKSLLPLAGSPALQGIVDHVLSAGVEDVVVVTGHRHDDIESFCRKRYDGRVRCVFNERYKDDANILSTEVGVTSLRAPEAGYMVIETDLVIEASGWDKILNIRNRDESFWVTRGKYSASLTGGALYSDSSSGAVRKLVYQPEYSPNYEGWLKLVGLLYVGSDQVSRDRSIRKVALETSISQHYMMPWVSNLSLLPCVTNDLGDSYAVSYNDVAAYWRANREYAQIVKTQPA